CFRRWPLPHPLPDRRPVVYRDFCSQLGWGPLQPPHAAEAVWCRMRKTIDRSIVLLCGAATLLILVMLAIILGNGGWHGAGKMSLEFLTQPPSKGMTQGGIFPAIYGTVLLVLLMSVAAVPFGVIVAIYFAEYAKRESRFYRWTRMAVNNLAGV